LKPPTKVAEEGYKTPRYASVVRLKHADNKGRIQMNTKVTGLLVLVLLVLPAAGALAEMSHADKRTADLIIKTCREVYKHKRPCP